MKIEKLKWKKPVVGTWKKRSLKYTLWLLANKIDEMIDEIEQLKKRRMVKPTESELRKIFEEDEK